MYSLQRKVRRVVLRKERLKFYEMKEIPRNDTLLNIKEMFPFLEWTMSPK